MIRSLLGSRTVWVLMGAALLLALGRMALRQLARDPRFLARPNAVLVNAPRWGGEAVVAPVRDGLRALGPINLFDAHFSQRIRAALLELPGVKRVDDIRRRWPDRYRVALTLHRPVAVVMQAGRAIPVTWDRTVLPAGPYRLALPRLMRIHGVDSLPAALGRPWVSEPLSEGLAALAQIQPHLGELNRLGLGQVDVSRADDPLEGVLLRGRHGIVVRWGRPRATLGENPVGQKIGYLREAARYIDQVRGMEIDVRYNTIYVRKPETQ